MKSILCLITVFVLASCSSSPYREIAQEQKSDVAKITDGGQAPHQFHSKRFEQYNSRY
jgi:hypothetical protein